MQTHDSVIVAKYLLSLAYEKRIALNVTKVQKLLFILYGFSLAKFGVAPIDEHPKAWPFGPVFPRTRKKADYGNILLPTDPCFTTVKNDKDLVELADYVVSNFSQYTASQLSEWSHMEDSPWHTTTKIPGFDWNAIIDDELIKSYFLKFKLD